MHYLIEREGLNDQRSSQQRIRDENLKWVFRLLCQHHELTRTDLTRMTGLSPTTVSALVEVLLRERLAVETGYARTLVTGRKPINLRICAEGRQIPVFSLSREGLRFVLYDLRLAVLEDIFLPMDSMVYSASGKGGPVQDYREGRDYVALMLDVLRAKSVCFDPVRSPVICITYPGVYIEGDERCFMPSMRISIRRADLLRMEEELGIPIFMGKTAESMTYAERKWMEAQGLGVDKLICVSVRNTVCMSVLVNGEILTDKFFMPGDVGHITINHRGKPCVCGNRGCLEQYVSQSAIIERVAQALSFHASDILPVDKREITLEMIGKAYDAGETEVVKVINEVAEQLFAGLCNIVCMTGIRRILLGGGIERLGNGFLVQLRTLAESMRSDFKNSLSIGYGLLDESATGLGTAQYYIDKVFEAGKA